MGDMVEKLKNWFAAAVAGVTLSVLLPAQAWAAEPGAAQLVVEAARKSRRSGGFGVFGLVCCLLVVGAAVVAFVLISRRRKRR